MFPTFTKYSSEQPRLLAVIGVCLFVLSFTIWSYLQISNIKTTEAPAEEIVNNFNFPSFEIGNNLIRGETPLIVIDDSQLVGSCGQAHKATFTTTPKEKLCETGSVKNFSGTGPWFWSCGEETFTPNVQQTQCFALSKNTTL